MGGFGLTVSSWLFAVVGRETGLYSVSVTRWLSTPSALLLSVAAATVVVVLPGPSIPRGAGNSAGVSPTAHTTNQVAQGSNPTAMCVAFLFFFPSLCARVLCLARNKGGLLHYFVLVLCF